MKIPVMPKGTFVFGRVLHNVLHDFFLEMENGGGQKSLFADTEKTVKPDLKKLQDLYKKHWQEEGYDSKEEKEKYKKLGSEILGNFYANIEKEGWPGVEFLEKSFTAKIGDYPFRGAIDRIDSLPDGSWEVVDYKTGETPANFYYQNKKQLLLYKIAIEETLGKKVSQLTFHYLKSGEKKSFQQLTRILINSKPKPLKP
jgi:RecB family exonuclease